MTAHSARRFPQRRSPFSPFSRENGDFFVPLARFHRKFPPLSAPPPPAFSHLLREGSSELPFCTPKHPRFEHFPPSFPSKRPKFCPSLPAFYRQLSPFRRNKPAFCRKPAGLIAKAPPFIVVSFRSRTIAPHDASPFFALPPFSEARFPHFLRPQWQPSGVLRKVPHNSPSLPSVRAAPPSFLPFVKPTAVKSAPHHCTFAHPMRQKHRIPARKTQICALLFAGCHRNCIFAVSYILVHGIYRAANRHLPWRQR